MPSRSEIIAQLKSRGTKGKLSKMKKAELQELLHRTAPPQLELEPDEQSGNGPGTYKEFVKAHLKQHGGNMSKAAATRHRKAATTFARAARRPPRAATRTRVCSSMQSQLF